MRKTIGRGVQNTLRNFARNKTGEPFYIKLVIKEGDGSHASFQPKTRERRAGDCCWNGKNWYSNAWAPGTGFWSSRITDQHVWKTLKISDGSGERAIDKTILLLPCSAQHLHLSLGYLSGLCSRCKDFSFSLCALDSLSPSVPFPQIALIHPYLNNFSFVWLMDKKIHFSTWRVARVVLMNKLMLGMWVSSGAVFCSPHSQGLLWQHIFFPEIACQKEKVDS